MTSLTALRQRLNSIVAHLTSRDFGGMETLTKKTIDTKRGYTYTYYVSPAKAGKPTLLLCHGFPDHAAQWEDLATKHLVPAGYGVVIPDLLGYDGTSKPTDPKEYAWDKMTADVCEILDAEKLDKVISVGHDWGAPMAQAMYKFHPERVMGLATMNVAYLPQPEGPYALDVVRPMITEAVGYFPHWYWYLFSHPVEGPEIGDAHVESFFDACHDQPEAWMDTLCTKDGAKNWLLQDKKANKLLPYATDDFKKAWVGRLKRDGFTAPFMWYRAMVEGHQYNVEKDLPAERYVVNVPTLFIGAKRDVVCLAAQIEQAKQMGLLPKLTEESVDAGHWCMWSNPREIGDMFLKWLGNNF